VQSIVRASPLGRAADEAARQGISVSSSLHSVLAFSDGRERRAIVSWLRGRPERDLERALGVVGLLAVDRSRAVKRFKDRIRKRLQRELDRQLQFGVKLS